MHRSATTRLFAAACVAACLTGPASAGPTTTLSVSIGGVSTSGYFGAGRGYGGYYGGWGGYYRGGWGGGWNSYYRPYWGPYWYGYSSRPYPSSLYVDTETLIALADRVDPDLLVDEQRPEREAEPAPPAPLDQRAREALHAHRYSEAAMLYQRLADEASGGESAVARRSAAVALVGAGDPARAAELIRKAHDADASLNRTPINAGMVNGRHELTRLAGVALRHARDAGTADAWFLAGVLLSSAGDRDAAREAFINAG